MDGKSGDGSSQRVLIISYCFAPQNIIGAVRPTKIAKYLARRGHQVTVLCGPGLGGITDPTLERDLRELSDVHVVREWNLLREYRQRKRSAMDAKPETRQPGTAGAGSGAAASQAALHGFMDALYLLLARLADRSFARRGWRTLKGMDRSFDAVLSSYGPHSVHQIAVKVKAKGMAKRWIADFRDPVQYPFPWQKGATRRYIRRVRERADEITGVSSGYLVAMDLLPGAGTVPNGFDPEDFPPQDAAAPQEGLSLAYCGQMYGAQRDVRPVFRALAELIQEGALNRELLRLDFAGKPLDWSAFLAQAAQCGLEDRAYNHGMLPRDQALALQRRACGILIAAWNTPEWPGNLPGKLLEALMLGRPILCCVTGEVAQSAAAEVIGQTRTGHCWEQARGDAADRELKAYLRELCRAAMAGQAMPFVSDAQAVEYYAYPQIAGRFEALL